MTDMVIPPEARCDFYSLGNPDLVCDYPPHSITHPHRWQSEPRLTSGSAQFSREHLEQERPTLPAPTTEQEANQVTWRMPDCPTLPPEAVEAATRAYWEAQGVELNELGHPPTALGYMGIALAAALPHLRPLFETATKVGLELGRKEALEEAAKLADDLAAGVANPEKPYNDAFIHACGVVARHIREIGTKETQP